MSTRVGLNEYPMTLLVNLLLHHRKLMTRLGRVTGDAAKVKYSARKPVSKLDIFSTAVGKSSFKMYLFFCDIKGSVTCFLKSARRVS